MPSAIDQASHDAAYYRRVLHDLIDVGVELVRELPRQAVPGDGVQNRPQDGAEVEPSLAYDRLTRAVRRSIMLARAIAEREAVPGQARAPRRAEMKRRVIRAVEDVIQRETDEAAGERLEAELLERVDSPEMEEDLDTRPVGEIITEICRDLGLGVPEGTHPYKRRTPEDVAALHARAGGAADRGGVSPALRDSLVRLLGAEAGAREVAGLEGGGFGIEHGVRPGPRGHGGAGVAAKALRWCATGPHPGPLP